MCINRERNNIFMFARCMRINRGDEKNVMQTSQKATSFSNRFITKNQEKVKKIFNNIKTNLASLLCNLKLHGT